MHRLGTGGSAGRSAFMIEIKVAAALKQLAAPAFAPPIAAAKGISGTSQPPHEMAIPFKWCSPFGGASAYDRSVHCRSAFLIRQRSLLSRAAARTKLLLEGSIFATLLRLAAPNILNLTGRHCGARTSAVCLLSPHALHHIDDLAGLRLDDRHQFFHCEIAVAV
jgi:hypothetical protein